MNKQIEIQKRKRRREARTRSNIFGTSLIPRLSVFRSNTSIYAQLIDDQLGKTLVSANIAELKIKDNKKFKENRKQEEAFLVGELLAQKALEKKIEKVQFDKGSYKYHGRLKSLAEGARKGGLKF
jgi:large subunit ribosomal protein L18